MSAVPDGSSRPPRRQTREIVVQMNTRVSLVTRALIDEVAYREGISIREVLERAVDAKWGSGAAAEQPDIHLLAATDSASDSTRGSGE